MARNASGSPNSVVTSRKFTFGFGQSRTVRTRTFRNAASSVGFIESRRSGTAAPNAARKTCNAERSSPRNAPSYNSQDEDHMFVPMPPADSNAELAKNAQNPVFLRAL